MRILVLSPNLIGRYNWGHQRFRNDIAKFHDVVFYGSGFPNFDPKKRVMDVINEYGNNFDFVFTCGLRYTLEFNGLEDVKHIPKVHFVVDYFPKHPSGYKGSWPRQHEFMKKNKFDLFFVTTGYSDSLSHIEALPGRLYLLESDCFSNEQDFFKRAFFDVESFGRDYWIRNKKSSLNPWPFLKVQSKSVFFLRRFGWGNIFIPRDAISFSLAF